MRDRALERFEALFGPEFGHGKPLASGPLRQALALFGDPQDKLPFPIHVAGANGKGSTIAFMRAIAEAGGLRVHAFTKPHLLELKERFLVSGEAIGDEMLIAGAERVARAAPHLTQFDAQVAAAFLIFSETPADITFIETGMGGRDDSTNVMAKPAATVIAPVALDHQDALGSRLIDIAAHKAGILRPGVAAIVARQHDEAREVIEAAAARTGAPLRMQGRDWDAHAGQGHLIVQTEDEILDLPPPTLAGAHQIDNAGLAVATLLYADAPIANEAFAIGIAKARLPARLQPLTRGEFSATIRAAGGEVWVDAGHNAHAAAALAQAMRAMNVRRQAVTLAIVGLRARKHGDSFLAALADACDHVIAVPLSEAHIAPEQIAAVAETMGAAASSAPSLAAAMQNAAHFRAPRVLICGSFLLAAEALAAENA